MQQRVTDYLDFGVPNVWIIDPETRREYACTSHGFVEPNGGVFEVKDSPIRLPLDEFFQSLD